MSDARIDSSIVYAAVDEWADLRRAALSSLDSTTILPSNGEHLVWKDVARRLGYSLNKGHEPPWHGPVLVLQECDDASGNPLLKMVERPGEWPIRQARIDASESGKGGLSIVLVGDVARVSAAKDTLDALSSSVMLAVAAAWRLRCVEEQLNQLTKAVWPTHESDDTVDRSRDPDDQRRRLMLSLSALERPLSDPGRFLSDPRSRRLFRLLAKRMGLPGWRRSLDEQAEVIDGQFEHRADLKEGRRLACWAFATEIGIIVLLAVDIALNVALFFWSE